MFAKYPKQAKIQIDGLSMKMKEKLNSAATKLTLVHDLEIT